MIRDIAPDDDMFIVADHYFSVGRQLADIAANAVGSEFNGSVLEVPCGHGRVTRHLLELLPRAKLTTADVLPSAVEFQRSVLGTNAILIEPPYLDYGQLPDAAFGLVIVGSLITHLDEVSARTILQQVARKLARDGTLVVTLHGDRSAQILREYNPYQVSDNAVAGLLSAYARGGFGFAPYLDSHTSEKNTVDHIGSTYGVSLASPDWLREEVASLGLTEISYTVGGWDNHQDVIVCSRHV